MPQGPACDEGAWSCRRARLVRRVCVSSARCSGMLRPSVTLLARPPPPCAQDDSYKQELVDEHDLMRVAGPDSHNGMACAHARHSQTRLRIPYAEAPLHLEETTVV